MAFKLFGFTISREDETDPVKVQSFTPPENVDGALEVSPLAGTYSTFLDQDYQAKTEAHLITRYREMSLYPECDYAIDDIINEAIITDEDRPPVAINVDHVKLSDSIKGKIREEFDVMLELLDFERKCYDIFRRWYIDGRLYYHVIIDVTAPKKGIQELRYIDPRKIRKVRTDEVDSKGKERALVQSKPKNEAEAVTVRPQSEFYIFNRHGLESKNGAEIQIALDSISYTHSGILDSNQKSVVSHLHKAIKPFNQLRMLEDALVIYRISRAPERRIFYVDVGNLPKTKAEQYLRDIMVKFKNKIVYNSSTGEISDDRQHRTMMEDYWLPRREGGKGTEITTLPGGENLGQIEDVMYFRKKMFRAMNVPISRLESDNGFNIGRSAEITRDEVKFGKFVARLRLKFTELFLNVLSTQLRLRGVMSLEDWNSIKNDIHFTWRSDTHFMELQDSEILRGRIEMLRDAEEFRGEYFSKEWLQKNILRQTDEEIAAIDKQINGEPEPTDDGNDGGNEPERSAPDQLGAQPSEGDDDKFSFDDNEE